MGILSCGGRPQRGSEAGVTPARGFPGSAAFCIRRSHCQRSKRFSVEARAALRWGSSSCSSVSLFLGEAASRFCDLRPSTANRDDLNAARLALTVALRDHTWILREGEMHHATILGAHRLEGDDLSFVDGLLAEALSHAGERVFSAGAVPFRVDDHVAPRLRGPVHDAVRKKLQRGESLAFLADDASGISPLRSRGGSPPEDPPRCFRGDRRCSPYPSRRAHRLTKSSATSARPSSTKRLVRGFSSLLLRFGK